jgi:hypothetical protein
MYLIYVVITGVVAAANGYAAYLSLAGADSVRAVADRVRVPARFMTPFGVLLAAGAIGLLAGFIRPVLGTAAAAGLVAYFCCALGAHIRVRDRGVGGAVGFLMLAVAALVAELAYRHHW